MALQDQLRNIRKQNNLSQEALAEQLGVSRQAVSKWESGSAYPETEKILAICRLYGLSADELLIDKADISDTAPKGAGEPPRKQTLRWMIPMAALFLAALILGGLLKNAKSEVADLHSQLSQKEAALAAETEEKSGLSQQLKDGKDENDRLLSEIEEQAQIISELKDRPIAAQSASESYALLQDCFFDFTQRWRLDYIPVFTENNAPTESAQYLMWAFAVNLPNWSDEAKGVMSRSYVEDMLRMHFAVSSVSHTPLPKTWNFDGSDYHAVAAGVNELPIYGLSSFSVSFENGTAVFDVLLTRYGLSDGSIPTEEQYAEVKEQLAVGNTSALTPTAGERFVFTVGTNGPVFRTHEIV